MPALDDLNGIMIGSEEIQSVFLGNQEIWANTPIPVDVPPTKYLIFTSAGGNTLSMQNYNGNAPVMWYSLNGIDWFIWKYKALTIPSEGSIYIAGNNPNGVSSSYSKYSKFVISGTGKVACSGDIMSLINPYQDIPIIPNYFCYYYMFEGCTSLVTAPELPATTLADRCYVGMFEGCTSLTTAPELPATELAEYCYEDMFNGCTSLTTAPELPATVLANACYVYMFYGCTSLDTAPKLPATTLADYCYSHMFRYCTSLTTAPELPATVLANACYYYMFYGCTSLVTAPELPATTLADRCYVSMFEGCTSLTTAPELPATELAEYCYEYMFNGCTSLTTAPELPATTLADYCYRNMFRDCTSLVMSPELPATTLVVRCYVSMFEGCTHLNYVKCLATDISATYCLSNWLYNVSSSGAFVKHPDMNDWPSGSSGIPSGWTVQDAVIS